MWHYPGNFEAETLEYSLKLKSMGLRTTVNKSKTHVHEHHRSQ